MELRFLAAFPQVRGAPPPPDIPSLPSVGLFSAARRASPGPRSRTRRIAAGEASERGEASAVRGCQDQSRERRRFICRHTGRGGGRMSGSSAAAIERRFALRLFQLGCSVVEKRKIRSRLLQPMPNHQFMRRRITGPLADCTSATENQPGPATCFSVPDIMWARR